MKKFLRNIVLVILILVSILILTGCSKTEQPAKLEKEKIGCEVVEYNAFVLPWRTYNSESELEDKIIIANADELKEFYNKIETDDYNTDGINRVIELFKNYDEEYFKNKSLAIMSVMLYNSGENIELNSAIKDGNSVKIEYEINSLTEGVALMVVSKGFIVVEVDKDITNIL